MSSYTQHEPEDLDDLEPWDSLEARAFRNDGWRDTAKQELRERGSDDGKSIIVPVGVFRRLALDAVEKLKQQGEYRQLEAAHRELQDEVGQLRAKVLRLEKVIEASTPTRCHPSDEIERAIEESRSILSLDDDWDDEGSPGYALATWTRATEFLRNMASATQLLPVPQISPAGSGSIDLYWRLESRTLLVNFPASDSDAAYFGKTSQGHTASGKISASADRPDIVAWLTA